MQERRKYVRLSIPLEINFSVEGQPNSRHQSIAKNISPNGIRFITDQNLSLGQTLDLDIKIPAKGESVPLKAKVVWAGAAKAEKGKGAFEVGLEFIQIADDRKSDFYQYLCNLMYDQLKRT